MVQDRTSRAKAGPVSAPPILTDVAPLFNVIKEAPSAASEPRNPA